MGRRGASSAPVLGRMGLALAVLGGTGAALADPKPRPVDIKPFQDRLIVLKDAEGGIYAVLHDGDERRVFYGTGKVLHEATYEGGAGRDGDSWWFSIHAPRIEYPFMGTIARTKDGSYRRTCGQKHVSELTELTGDKAREVIARSQFLTTNVIRKPYMLARDDKGVYYYVDVLRDEYGGHGHRVLVGKKGALKQLPLVDVASDSAGDVFATRTGDLRLVRTLDGGAKPTAEWVRGEKKSSLVYLDTYMNQPLIFRDLGVYRYSGLICGNF